MNRTSIALLVAAVGVVFWLLRRRRQSRENAEDSRVLPASAGSATEKLSIPTVVTETSRQSEIQNGPEESIRETPEQTGGTSAMQVAPAVEELTVGVELHTEVGLPEVSRSSQREQGEGAAASNAGQIAYRLPIPMVESLSQAEGLTSIVEKAAREIEVLAEESSPEYSSGGFTEHPVERVNTIEDTGNGKNTHSQNQEPASDATTDKDVTQIPLRYRPPQQRPPRQSEKQNGKSGAVRTWPAEVISGIRVHVFFDRFSFCTFSLLPERQPDLDEEVPVTLGARHLRLFAQEVWYQDLGFADAATQLRQGLELVGRLADGRRARWLLKGRDLYVLASHPSATGYISTNRLALGRSHVVIFTADIVDTVEAILVEAGCTGYTKLDQSHGFPAGWFGLRDVLPTKAMSLGPGSDPFYAIKPPPDIEIEFESGLWLRNSVWLAGYPPQIKLLGDLNLAAKVLIDGKEAALAHDGCLIADSYDSVGQHTVYVEGLSCSASYAIEEAPSAWEQWPAYCYGEAAICGPLVELQADSTNLKIVTVPMTNPVLLGAAPGEVFYCSRRGVAQWRGYVPFDPVWALPLYPLTSNKESASIVRLSDRQVLARRGTSKATLRWSNAILDASRKGLRINGESSELRASWNAYKKVARNIWRAAR